MHRSPSRKTGEAPPPKGLPFLVEWPVAFLLVMLARLPYLLGDHVFFDGDEAIIGIMARDLLSLNGSPFYFYGQQYGFSLFETLAAALFTVFLGSGVASLKLGGMLLFSLGIQRLMRVLRSKGLPWSGYLLFALVLAMFPPWTVWGTMLRGGYITAFVAVCFIIEHLLLYPVWQRRHWLAVGLSVAVIAVSQVFFVLVVFPLLTQRLLAMSRRDILPVFGLGLMALVLLRLPAYLNPDLWMPTGMGSVHVCNLFHRFIAGFWSYFTGFFLYEYEVAVPTGLRIACMVFVALMSVLLLLVIWRSPKAANVDLLLLALGTVMAAFPITLFERGGGRYLL
ncbi:MAG: hypothetical protein K9J06_07295, partial [Flavobacteriales bacterium]|nr:hypothetical protein [Flavobacteriales bacterium]